MSASGLRIVRALGRGSLAAIATVVLTAAPAGADPAGPTDFRSSVTRIVPALEGVRAEIRGGDAFLELTVDRGREVEVEGYQGEPYLRFLADGTVERNARSAATYLNEDRRGADVVPPNAQDPTAEPEWVRVGGGGSYAWHDHRVHWMSEATPSVDRGQRVPGAYDPWKVPIEVDGAPAVVQGTLTYATAVSPVIWLAAGVALAGGLGWLGRSRPSLLVPIALVVGGAAAFLVGRADFSSTPGGGNPLLWALPAFAVATGAIAAVPRLQGAATIGALASVASLSGWALLRFQVLTKPILPTALPFWIDRATTAAALGISVAAAYLAVTSGHLGFAPLEDDE